MIKSGGEALQLSLGGSLGEMTIHWKHTLLLSSLVRGENLLRIIAPQFPINKGELGIVVFGASHRLAITDS
ncbi:MAG: hypothetical protein Kow0090_04430 [Myxococcota bacterium]